MCGGFYSCFLNEKVVCFWDDVRNLKKISAGDCRSLSMDIVLKS